MATLDEIMREEEARRLAVTRAEIAAEQAAWNALTPEQQAAKVAARNAKYDAIFAAADEAEGDDEACDICGEELDDDTGDCPYCDAD